MATVDPTKITYWCSPGNSDACHAVCHGFWRLVDGTTGPCLCRHHHTFDADAAADLMAEHAHCPRCQRAWDDHDFGEDQTVACPTRRGTDGRR